MCDYYNPNYNNQYICKKKPKKNIVQQTDTLFLFIVSLFIKSNGVDLAQ